MTSRRRERQSRLDRLMNADRQTLAEVFVDSIIAIGSYVHATGVDDPDLEALSLALNAQVIRLNRDQS